MVRFRVLLILFGRRYSNAMFFVGYELLRRRPPAFWRGARDWIFGEATATSGGGTEGKWSQGKRAKPQNTSPLQGSSTSAALLQAAERTAGSLVRTAAGERTAAGGAGPLGRRTPECAAAPTRKRNRAAERRAAEQVKARAAAAAAAAADAAGADAPATAGGGSGDDKAAVSAKPPPHARTSGAECRLLERTWHAVLCQPCALPARESDSRLPPSLRVPSGETHLHRQATPATRNDTRTMVII